MDLKHGLFRVMASLRVPDRIYYWLLDRLYGMDGWRPLSYRQGPKRPC